MIIVKNGVLYILIEFESDRISAINGRICAHGWNFDQFWPLIRNLRWKLSNEKFSCLSDNFEIFVIFEFSNGHFGEMAKYIGNFFFLIFGEIDVFYILAEFEVDGRRPNESTKMDERALKG